jgi:dipeptidyl aminopeptidase/acylaminoacyl peptidase
LFDLPRQPRVTDIVALSSGGDRLAYVLHENASFTIHCLDLKLGKDALLVTGSGWLLSLSWSPNDKAIAYYSAKQRGGNEGSSVSLRVLEVPSGRNKQVAPESKKTRLGGESRFPPVWSSDGESIFIEARYGDAPPAYHVYQVDDEGETAPVYITSGLCTSVYNDVLYVADGGVFTVNLTNGRREVLSTKGTFPRISPSGQAIAFASSDGIYCKPLRKGAVAKVSSGSWPDEFGGYCGYFWTAAADLSQSVQAKPQTPVTPK